MDRVLFGADDIENRLAQDPDRVELLPFGAIRLDPTGKVLSYNRVECEISSRVPGDVIGRNFFNEVAPCSKGHIFHGRFFEAVAKGSVDRIFEYHFDYKMKPTRVMIHLKSARTQDGIWVFVKRL